MAEDLQFMTVQFKTILLSLTLMVSASTAIAAPPPKAGSPCSKVGLSKNYQDKKFICIKSGKKLVWDKGTKIPAKNSAQANPTETIDPWIRASRDIVEQLKNSKSVNVNLDFSISNDAHPLFVDHAKDTILKSAQFWGNTYLPSKTIPVAIAAPKSLDSVTTHLGKYSYSIPDWRLNQLKNLREDDMQLDVDANPSSDSVVYFVVGNSTSWLTANMAKTMITHEYVHAVQVGILKTRNGLIPCWSNEGSAIFYGNSIVAATDSSLEYLALRNNWLKQLNFKSVLTGKSDSELLELLKRSENDFQVCAAPLRLGYSAGSLMTELLVAEHGHKKFVNWWLQSKDKNWKVAFKEVFGLDVDDFYSKTAIPYLQRASASL